MAQSEKLLAGLKPGEQVACKRDGQVLAIITAMMEHGRYRTRAFLPEDEAHDGNRLHDSIAALLAFAQDAGLSLDEGWGLLKRTEGDQPSTP
jgi:hypothetical protein